MSIPRGFCRLCFTDSNMSLKVIEDPIREKFYSLTNIMLIKMDVYSNFICSKCEHKINDTHEYVQILKTNELRLQSELEEKPKIVFAESLAEVPQEVKVEGESDIKIVDVHMAFESIEEVAENQQAQEVPSTSNTLSELGPYGPILPIQPQPQRKKYRYIRPGVTLGRKRIHPEIDEIIKTLPLNEKGKVSCPDCNRKVSKRHCKTHILRNHVRISPYSCDICGKGCQHLSEVRAHMKIHIKSLSKGFLCEFGCNESFPSTTARKAHLKKVHPEVYSKDIKFICEDCAGEFNSLDALRHHRSSVHLGIRYKCPYEECGLEFRSEYYRGVHVKNAHEFTHETCEFCGKVLKKGSQMRNHKRLNHAEKKFACKHCDMKFRLLAQLREHENRHEGNKSHQCKYCDASYYSYRKLICHINIVHKKQKYVCEIPGCSSEFRSKTNYRVHIKTCHKELSADEVTKTLERITLVKPTFRLTTDQIGQIDNEEEAPKGKRGRRKALKY